MPEIRYFKIPLITLKQRGYAVELKEGWIEPSEAAQEWVRQRLERQVEAQLAEETKWLGQELPDVYPEEFRKLYQEYYQQHHRKLADELTQLRSLTGQFGKWKELQPYMHQVRWDYSRLGPQNGETWQGLKEFHLEEFLRTAQASAEDSELRRFAVEFKKDGQTYNDVRIVPEDKLMPKGSGYDHVVFEKQGDGHFCVMAYSGQAARLWLHQLKFIGVYALEIPRELKVFAYDHEEEGKIVAPIEMNAPHEPPANGVLLWGIRDWKKLKKNQLETWLSEVRKKTGNEKLERFALEIIWRHSEGRYQNHRITAVPIDYRNRSGAMLYFKRMSDGSFCLWNVKGDGSVHLAKIFRDRAIAGLILSDDVRRSEAAKEKPWKLSHWEKLKKSQLHAWLKEARKISADPHLQTFAVKFAKSGETYFGVAARPAADVLSDEGFGFLVIHYDEQSDRFNVVSSKGYGAAELVSLLSRKTRSWLDFHSEALVQRAKKAVWTREQWKQVDARQYAAWLEEARRIAKDPHLTRFVLQFASRGETYEGVSAVPEYMAKERDARLTIELAPDKNSPLLHDFKGKGSANVAGLLLHEVSAPLQVTDELRELIAKKQASAEVRSAARRGSSKGFIDLELLTLPFTAPSKLMARAMINETTGPVLGNLVGDYLSKRFFGDEEQFDVQKSLGFMGLDFAVRSVVQAPLASALAGRSASVQRFARNNVPFLATSALMDLARGEFHPLEYAQQLPTMALGSAAADGGVAALVEVFGKRVMSFAGRFVHPLISFTVLHGVGELRAQMERDEHLSAAAQGVAATQSLRYPQLRSPSAQQEALWNYVSERLNFSQAGQDYQELQRKIAALSKNPLEYMGEPILQVPFVSESDLDLLLARARVFGKVDEVHEGFRKGLEDRVQRMQNEINYFIKQVERHEKSEGKLTAILMRQKLEEQLAEYQHKTMHHLAKREGLQGEELSSLQQLLVINQRLQQKERIAEMEALLARENAALTQAERDELQHMRFDCSHEASWNEYCQMQSYVDQSGAAWQQRLREDVAGVDVAFGEVQETPLPEELPLEDFSRYNDMSLDLALIALQQRGFLLFSSQKQAPQNELSEQDFLVLQ